MYRFCILAAALALSSPAHAQVEPGIAEVRARVASLTAGLVGRYEYRDREMTGTVELRADGSFDYHFKGVGAPVEGEERLDYHLVGVWRVGPRGRITLTQAPPAAEFLQTTSRVDPGVAAAVAITVTGVNAQWQGGLLLLVDDDAVVELDASPHWSLPAGKPRPRTLEIIRNLDGRSLARVALARTGPNRFNFTYTPGPPSAFNLSARQMPGKPDTIAVELGQAGVPMTRVQN